MPLPDKNIPHRLRLIADWLEEYGTVELESGKKIVLSDIAPKVKELRQMAHVLEVCDKIKAWELEKFAEVALPFVEEKMLLADQAVDFAVGLYSQPNVDTAAVRKRVKEKMLESDVWAQLARLFRWFLEEEDDSGRESDDANPPQGR